MHKINIYIPNNNTKEREYIIDIFFDEFLGLKYNLLLYDNENYKIVLPNKNNIIIKDAFFGKFKSEKSYLDKKNIPEKIIYAKNQFTTEKNIPVLFGTENLIIKKDEIICENDIFAASFFMLTRWEEFVEENRDEHNRFPAKTSLAYKQNFLQRPIVNEYIEMLWNFLKHLNCNQKRKNSNFDFTITHDVDLIANWTNFINFIKTILGDIVKRRNIRLAKNNIKNYFLSVLKIEKDNFDTFDFLMKQAERVNKKAEFYFMTENKSSLNSNYKISNNKSTKLISKINLQNHIIGFHPSYYSYNNPEQWKKEYDRLTINAKQKIKTGRQHFLKFEIPTTWQIWEDNNMKKNSTMYYPEFLNFRCGVCYEFSVFNILSQKKLTLKESPLIFMETTFLSYMNINNEKKFIDKITESINIVRKYSGNFVFLWHNSNFINTSIDSKKLYINILNILNNEN